MKENNDAELRLQCDYNYFLAQKAAERMLCEKLISQAEFNKLTRLNRDTFSPDLVELMPKIPLLFRLSELIYDTDEGS